MTHDELVERAGRWLLNTKRCKLVILEPKPCSCLEHPDAIGWLASGESIVVECKASLTDLRHDRYKRWRSYTKGMGFWRYFLTPRGLLNFRPNDGTGLLEVHGRTIKVMLKAEPRMDRQWSAELCLLLSRLSNGRRLLTGKDGG